MQTKNIIRPAIVTLLLLLIPFLAMQFNWQVGEPGGGESNTVNWDLTDFVVMGILLFGTGIGLELILNQGGKYRIVGAIGIVLLFFYIWAELAVGIFTNWGS